MATGNIQITYQSLSSQEQQQQAGGSSAAELLWCVFVCVPAEILELAGNAARDNKKGRITPRHIKLAVANDDELNQVTRQEAAVCVCQSVCVCCCFTSFSFILD